MSARVAQRFADPGQRCSRVSARAAQRFTDPDAWRSQTDVGPAGASWLVSGAPQVLRGQ